jgi:membrane-associated HD superfamily phosphohydrolase
MSKQLLKSVLLLIFLFSFQAGNHSQDSLKSASVKQPADSLSKGLQIDTAVNQSTLSPAAIIDTVKAVDSLLVEQTSESTMTNTKLFIYILMSVLGLSLFFFIFVMTLFKTFHKKKSTRQSLLLSWSLFFIVSLIWIFIVWGLVAGFWTVSSFMIVMIFLFIISFSMTIIALKTK